MQERHHAFLRESIIALGTQTVHGKDRDIRFNMAVAPKSCGLFTRFIITLRSGVFSNTMPRYKDMKVLRASEADEQAKHLDYRRFFPPAASNLAVFIFNVNDFLSPQTKAYFEGFQEAIKSKGESYQVVYL